MTRHADHEILTAIAASDLLKSDVDEDFTSAFKGLVFSEETFIPLD